MTEPDRPQPRSPDELGLRADRLREGAAARDDHAQPPGGPERVRLPDAARARAGLRGRLLGRRDPRRRRSPGAGRAFCVGADLRSWADEYLGNPTEYWKWFGAFKDAHDRLREIGKPTLARINGIAVGGGNELQMACDLAVMVDDAFIRHVGPEHGSVPAGGATQWLTIMVGDRRAREIVLMCEEIPAAQAAEWGLVNWAVPAAELDAKVDEVVEKLARKLPQTTRYAKQHLNFWRDLAWHETINHARDWLALSMATEEPQAAIERFLERK